MVARMVAVILIAKLRRTELHSPSGSQIDVQLLAVNVLSLLITAVADLVSAFTNDSAMM
jgi:hypothetical protein